MPPLSGPAPDSHGRRRTNLRVLRRVERFLPWSAEARRRARRGSRLPRAKMRKRSGNPQIWQLVLRNTGRTMKYTFALFLLLAGGAHSQGPQVLSPVAHIDLPNVDGRIDHFSADLKGQRLFISALGNHTVEVLDVQSGKRLRPLSDLAEPPCAYI